jgi:hypothetical protein
MNMTFARAPLLRVLALSLLLPGCNTTTVKSSEDANGVTAESVHQAERPMNFGEAIPRVYTLSQLPLARNELDIRCQGKVGDLYVSFVGIEEGGIFIVAVTKRALDDPGRNLYTHTPRNGLPEGATLDWGYALDRNFDGKIDYLAILDKPYPVVPAGWKGELPDLRGERAEVSGEALKTIVLPNTRLLFWHIADDNFDGYHDASAASTRNRETGWVDGWMVAQDTNFDGIYDVCNVFEGQFQIEPGSCVEDSAGYKAPGREPSGLSPFPPARDFWVFELINQGAEECGLSGADFRSVSK